MIKIDPKIIADLIEEQGVYVRDIARCAGDPEDLTKMTVDGRVDFVRLAKDLIVRGVELSV